MPIFMDRHIVPRIEAKQAALAHREDLKIQDEYACRCMMYWVDENHGSAFCLIDAPDEKSVKMMHDRAHGLVPHEIMQVNSNVVEAFLGRIADPEGYADQDDPNLKIFNDTAFRIILVAQTTDIGLLNHQLGKEKAKGLMTLYHDIIRKKLHTYEGRELEMKGQVFTASFVSVTKAVDCAAALQKEMDTAGELINLRIGLNAGMPVEKSKELFGDIIKMARYLSVFASHNQIVLASIIKETYKDDGHSINGEHRYKWINPVDENFLQMLMDTQATNWSDSGFSIADFCGQISMSKSTLYRKCTQLTGMSPNNLLREYRLLKSLDLLKSDRSIFQTTFDCGFTSPSYFGKCFHKRFGMPPLYYQKNLV